MLAGAVEILNPFRLKLCIPSLFPVLRFFPNGALCGGKIPDVIGLNRL